MVGSSPPPPPPACATPTRPARPTSSSRPARILVRSPVFRGAGQAAVGGDLGRRKLSRLFSGAAGEEEIWWAIGSTGAASCCCFLQQRPFCCCSANTTTHPSGSSSGGPGEVHFTAPTVTWHPLQPAAAYPAASPRGGRVTASNCNIESQDYCCCTGTHTCHLPRSKQRVEHAHTPAAATSGFCLATHVGAHTRAASGEEAVVLVLAVAQITATSL